MPATKAQKQKAPQGPMFPSRDCFEGFLEEVKHLARGAGVKHENIPLILELLTEKFGQNLPEEEDV